MEATVTSAKEHRAAHVPGYHDELREQAPEVLAKSLRGEKVDREQLAAAKALFSYRADAPPVPEQPRAGEAGSKVVGLTDLVEAMAESRFFSRDFGLTEEEERRLLENVRARKARRAEPAAAHMSDLPRQGRREARIARGTLPRPETPSG